MSRFLSILSLLILLASGMQAQNSLQTGSILNGAADGIMFDVDATFDIRINGVELFLEAGAHAIEIYRVTGGGTFIGHEDTPSDWTLIDTVILTSLGRNAPTVVPSNFEINVPSGGTQGLYFTSPTQSGVNYEIGFNSGGVDISNGHLSIREGVGKAHAFGATSGSTNPGGSSNKFRGSLHYSLGNIGTEISLTTSPSATVVRDSMTFDVEALRQDLIVTGFSAYLSAGIHDLDLWVTERVEENTAAGPNFGNWRLIGRATNFDVSQAGTFRLPMDFEAVIPANGRRGFYLTSNVPNALRGESQPFDGASATMDSDLQIYSGTSYQQNFGTLQGTHMIDGVVHYRVPNQSSAIVSQRLGILTSPATFTNVTVGCYFDLTASTPLVITSLNHNMQFGSHLIEVWVVTDGTSFNGNESDASAWTLISSMPVTVAVAGRVTVAQDLRLFIPEGGSQGIYITGTSNSQNSLVVLQDPSSPAIVAQDANLAMTIGTSSAYSFTPQALSVIPGVEAVYRPLGRAEKGFYEDFFSASGINPPLGWISSFKQGNRPKLDGWRWDNPGARTPTYPLVGSVAICDSDEAGNSNPIEASLISPTFDASNGNVKLSFDYFFRQFNVSIGTVDVWDGLGWSVVATYNTTSADPERADIDITVACGGFDRAMVRFSYVGDFDWYWMIDNVHVQLGQTGQRPQLGIGEFDINYAKDAVFGQPVSSGLPGPYEATTNIVSPTIFTWEGEPNQPIQFFAGPINLGNVVLNPQGQLDVGSYDPLTNTFPGIILLGDGTAPDFLNATYRTSNAGILVKSFIMPPFTLGNTFHFQSVVFSSTQNIAITNVVSLTVMP